MTPIINITDEERRLSAALEAMTKERDALAGDVCNVNGAALSMRQECNRLRAELANYKDIEATLIERANKATKELAVLRNKYIL